MSGAEIVDAILRAAELLLNWPMMIFIVILLFKGQISALLPALAARVNKVSFLGTAIEFAELTEKINELPPALGTFVREKITLRDLLEGFEGPLSGPERTEFVDASVDTDDASTPTAADENSSFNAALDELSEKKTG
jgi:hypothetical protein